MRELFWALGFKWLVAILGVSHEIPAADYWYGKHPPGSSVAEFRNNLTMATHSTHTRKGPWIIPDSFVERSGLLTVKRTFTVSPLITVFWKVRRYKARLYRISSEGEWYHYILSCTHNGGCIAFQSPEGERKESMRRLSFFLKGEETHLC